MFFIGHSHVVCLEQAANAHGVAYESLNLWGFGRPVIYGEGPPRLNPELGARLDDYVISAVGGSAHDMAGLAQHPRPFDFVLPEAPDLPLTADAEIIPYASVRNALRALMEDEQLDLLRLLCADGRRVLHIESPPPFADNERLEREMGALLFVPQPNQGPSTPWLRYKLWRVHSTIVREACEAAGVSFVPCPADSLVQSAFLKPELYAYPCHANAGYGELVLRQLGLVA